jgi:methionyl-tRNA formyltransferase
MDKIKIGYFADGPWSHKAFEKLIENSSIEILFIVPRSDTQDDTLKKLSLQYNIDYLYPVKINSMEFIELVKSYKADLFVSMSFNQIFKAEILDIPEYGVINCHAGRLPFYRGRNILNWALINDEQNFGITVHYVDEGIDTGDIINQKIYPITDEDDYDSLLKVAYIECASILFETILQIRNGIALRLPQSIIHPIGFYCGRRGPGDEIINWNQSTREIFNFIRAICNPGPMATSYLNNSIIRINKSKIIDMAPIYKGTCGQILAKTDKGYLVKTADSFIEIMEIDSEIRLKIGDILGK